MKKEEMTTEEKAIQKTLNKIMSEEMLAHMLYMGCIVATCKCKAVVFEKLFIEIAEDELNDHFINLKKWAVANDFEVPFKMKDYIKYAPECNKQLDKIKMYEDPLYYIDEAIKSEQFAIASYEEVLQDTTNIPYELNAIMLQNYYDELEHLDDLMIMKYAIEAGAELVQY